MQDEAAAPDPRGPSSVRTLDSPLHSGSQATRVLEIRPSPDPVEAFTALSGLPYPLFLDSAARGDARGRYSYITASPREIITARRGETRVLQPVSRDLLERRRHEVLATRSDPLQVVAQRLAAWKRPSIAGLPPFQGGAAGVFGYDLCRSFEKIPLHRRNEFEVPDLALGIYDWVLAFDHAEDTCHLLTQRSPRTSQSSDRDNDRRAEVLLALLQSGARDAPTDTGEPALGPDPMSFEPTPSWPLPLLEGLRSNFSRDEYLAAVERAREYIRAGDIFQVNLSQRLLFPAKCSPRTLYRRLRATNPAPFAGYFETDSEALLSSSPEHFLTLEGRSVVTRPIKGTRPRGKTPREDARQRALLLESEKDRAENVMIVDLLRNDLSRVARPYSVRVPSLFELETHPTVHHLVSEVHAELREGASAVDLVRSSFPGGSVTGAPKIRAMEILAELEPHARGFYCGSLGWLSFQGDLQLNILIRTLTFSRGWIQLPVGGGIVAPSDPESEYEETLHKAGGMLRALQQS